MLGFCLQLSKGKEKGMITDKEIMTWSLDNFGEDVDAQWLKLEEETEELKKELADVWIVMCGLKARGVKKLPSFKTFCTQHTIEEKVLRDIIDAKMAINIARTWIADDRGVYCHKEHSGFFSKLKALCKTFYSSLINIIR